MREVKFDTIQGLYTANLQDAIVDDSQKDEIKKIGNMNQNVSLKVFHPDTQTIEDFWLDESRNSSANTSKLMGPSLSTN
jgi:hypothetical protein